MSSSVISGEIGVGSCAGTTPGTGGVTPGTPAGAPLVYPGPPFAAAAG
jgi:hypothetical protein